MFLGKRMEQGHSVVPFILSLPTELMVIIISYLTSLRDRIKLRYVSQRLRSVIEVPSLWYTFVWDYYDSREELCLNSFLKTCGPYIKLLAFPGYVVPQTLVKMLQYCYNVRHLSLPLPVGTVLHPGELEVIRQMKDLHTLNIPWETDIKPLLMVCSNLKELTVYVYEWEMSSDVYIEEWVSLGFRPPNLNIVFTSNKLPSTTELVQKWKLWNTRLPVNHIAHLKLFVRFKIPLDISPTLPAFQLQFSPTAVLPLIQAKNCGINVGSVGDVYLQLTDRCIGNCKVYKASKVTGDYPTVHHTSSLHSVTHFDITRYVALRYHHLEQLAIACPNLQQLKLRNCYECLRNLNGLNAIANHCPNLKGLNILGISRYNMESQVRLWEILSILKLTHLGVEMCAISLGRHDFVYQDKMTCLYQRCSNLLAIDSVCSIFNCGECKSSHFKKSLVLSHFSSLKYCRVSNSSSTSVQDIISSCTELQCFSIRSSKFRNLSLSAVHTCNLQQLFMYSRFIDIPDNFISSVSVHNRLIHVFLYVASASIAGIKTLIVSSPNLLTFHSVLELYDLDGRKLSRDEFMKFTGKLKQEFHSQRLFHAGSCKLFQLSELFDLDLTRRYLECTDLHTLWDATF